MVLTTRSPTCIKKRMLSEPLRRLIAADPRRAMDEALQTIIIRTKGKAAGLFLAKDGHRPALLASRLDQAGIDRVRAAWSDRAREFRDGRPLVTPDYHVWPLDPGDRGLPLVYIEAAGPLRIKPAREAVAEVGEILMATVACDVDEGGLTQAESVAVDRYLASVNIEAGLKRQLVAHLERQEGNVSRTARRLGISRTTLYQYLKLHGITRPPRDQQ